MHNVFLLYSKIKKFKILSNAISGPLLEKKIGFLLFSF